MSISKDQSIVTQVAAKIAADLTAKTDDTMTNVSNWIQAFDAVTEALLQLHGFNAEAPVTQEQAVANVMQAFPTATVTNTTAPTGGWQVRIKGKQHGPIPEWLPAMCAAKGVTEVWDNRDGLSANPKRPWFKSTNTDDAFWAPRGK